MLFTIAFATLFLIKVQKTEIRFNFCNSINLGWGGVLDDNSVILVRFSWINWGGMTHNFLCRLRTLKVGNGLYFQQSLFLNIPSNGCDFFSEI